METEKIYSALFRSNDKKELKFNNNFTQLTPIDKRIVFIIVNLAIGENQVKKIVQQLREKKKL